MATKVDELLVQISADTKDLKNAFVKAKNTVDSSTKQMAKSTDILDASISRLRLTALAVAASLVFMGKSMIKEVDNIQKLSVRLGESTENLSRLKFVAEQSGIAFNTLTMGLQRMQRRVAEASKGTGEAKDAIKELGLSAQELHALNLSDQFLAITRAMENVESTADRTRLAMKLFDSEGVALTQIMDQGALAVRKLANETPNIITEKTAQNIVDFNDNMHKLIENIKKHILPVINKMAKAVNTAFDLMSRSVNSMTLEMELLKAEVSRLEDGSSWVDRLIGNDKTIEKKKRRIAELQELIEQRQKPKNMDDSKSDTTSNIDGFIKLKETAVDTSTTINKSMKESTSMWSDDLADAILDAKGDFQSLADFANDVLRQISKNMITQSITDPLVEAGTNLGKSFLGGGKASSSSGVNIQQNFNISSGAEVNAIDKKIAEAAPIISQQAQMGVFEAINRGGGAARQVGRRG